MKRTKIYNELHHCVISGRYSVGEKLPTEYELCAHYSVARGTIREALKQLEEEGFVERIKSKGTFVRRPPFNPSERVISFLIPYPGYMRISQDPLFSSFTRIFYGTIQAATESNWRVETIPFSLTNDNHDIDWDSLVHLDENSHLIIFNKWYHTAFEEFHRRHIKVAIIRYFSEFSPWDHCFSDWINSIVTTREDICDTLEALYERGSRRILNANTYYNDPFNEKTLGYREIVNRHGLEPIELDYDQFNDRPDYLACIKQAIHETWEKTHFDTLFFADAHGLIRTSFPDLYQAFGIPETVKILNYRNHPYFLSMSPQISALAENHYDIGYATAKALMEEPYQHRDLFFHHNFYDRESTGGPYVSTAENISSFQEPLFG